MSCINKYIFPSLWAIILFCITISSSAFIFAQDSTLIYPITPTFDPTSNTPQSFDLGDPSSMTQTIVYDPITGRYIFTETLGNGLNYRNPSMMTLSLIHI